jgi:hypothetical protein
MHHPPFITGMWWMDYGGLDASSAFDALLRQHRQVVGVLAGHVHRAFTCTIANALVSTAPALTYQSCLALDGETSPPLVSDVVAPIPLLRWTGDRLLAASTDFRLPQKLLDLSTVIPNWDDYERCCRTGAPIAKDH